MFKEIIAVMRKPNVRLLKQDELLEAEMALMKAQTGLEYAQSMVTYNTTRINRLRTELGIMLDQVKYNPNVIPIKDNSPVDM